jgi:DNA polymerase
MVIPHDGDGKFMVLGEAPGKQEAKEGKPFVGKSGKLVFSTLKSNDILRKDCWVTNVVKVRPKNNRTPTEEEILEAMPSLRIEIAECKPHVILALGTVACKALFNKMDLKISEVRGVPLEIMVNDTIFTVVPCFHPSYIFRKTTMLATFQKDIQTASQIYKERR